MLRATQAQISLAHIAYNLKSALACLQDGTDLMAVVKADAYGHGMVQVAKTALDNGASWLGVAIAAEAVALRHAGIAAPILVFGAPVSEGIEDCVRYGITQTVFDSVHVQAIQGAAQRLGKKADVHVKLDTGMHRLGLQHEEEIDRFLAALSWCDHVNVTGVFTHFACADAQDESSTLAQGERFAKWLPRVRTSCGPLKVHACNSAGIVRFPQFHFDMVRLGISLYGYAPSEYLRGKIPLLPAMRLRSEVVRVFAIAAGERVGYGGTYTATDARIIATIPIGYGDGYMRILSNRAQVLVRGQRAPIVGRVCMDQMMVDVSQIHGVQTGDEVVLWGMQPGGRRPTGYIGADEVAQWAETISYETLLSVSSRVPRIYE